MGLDLRSRAAVCLVGAACLHCSADDAPPATGNAPNDTSDAALATGMGGGAGSSATTGTGGKGSEAAAGTSGQAGGIDDASPPSTDATIDAAAEGGVLPCPALFCEDFENGLDLAKWTLDVQGGTATVATDRAAHGTKALKVVLGAQGDHAAISMDAPADIVKHLFGRAYFYLSSASQAPPSPAHTVYFTAGDGLGQKHYEVGGYDKGWQLSYWFPGGENIAGGGVVPVNKWACVEWELDDAPNGTIRIFIEGTKNAEFTNAGGGNKVTKFQTLTFGMKYFQHIATEATLYLDDLAIDTKRVNCID